MHLLIVKDRAEEWEQIILQLRHHFTDLHLTEVANADDLDRALEQSAFDLVLTGCALGWADGLLVLQRIQARFPEVPIVMFCQASNQGMAVEAIRLGHGEYLHTDNLERLPEAVQTLVERTQLQSELRRSYEELETRVQERTKELAQANEASQRWATELDAVVNSIADGVILYDTQGQVVRINQRTHDLLGYSPEEHGRNPAKIIPLFDIRFDEEQHQVNPAELAAVRALRGETVCNQLMSLQCPGESERTWFLASAAPIRQPDGQMLGVVATFSDITPQRRGQEQLRLANEELQNQAAELEAQTAELRRRTDELNAQTQELATERARLQAIIQYSPYAIVVTDAQARILLTNPAADRLYGRPVPYGQDYESHAALQLCYPDGTPYNPRDLPVTHSALDGESFFDIELAIIWPDGQRREFLASSVPIRDDRGRVTGALGMFQDITERKRMERELQQSEEKYHHLVQYAPTFIYTIDFHGPRFTEVNDIMCDFLGYSCAELITMNPFDLLDDASKALFQSRREQWLRGEKPQERVEYTGSTRGGREVVVVMDVTFLVDESGRPWGATVIGHDITERKQAEEERERLLQEIDAERARLQAILNSLPVGVWVADASGKLTLANDTATKIYGDQALLVDRAEAYLAYPLWWPGTEERVPVQDYPLARALRGETVKEQVLDLGRVDGTRSTQLASSVPIRDSQGRLRGAVVAVMDITAQRRAEQALQQALAEAEEARQLSEVRNRINDLLVSVLDVMPVLPQVLAETAQGLGLNYGVFLYRKGESWMTGPVYGLPQLPSGHVFSEQEAELTTWAAQHRQVLAVEDVTQDPRFQATVLRGYGVRSFIDIPLILQERVTGALLLGSSEVVQFRPAQLDFARKMASGLALALENARLYEQAQKDAETRATLLREVNHRVKNNLAAIIELLYAQADQLDAESYPQCRMAIQEVTHRIEGLSVVHGLLSAAQWMPLRLDQLVEQIVSTTLQAVPAGQVRVEVEPSTVRVSPDQAHTLALVINELALNVGKHALQTGASVRVTAQATTEDGHVVLIFRDNGPGYPEEVIAGRRVGVGLGLLRSLVARNLRGELMLRNEAGAVTEIRFPLVEAGNEEKEAGG